MDWRLKATMQWAFSMMPGGEAAYYLCQRHVTRSLPASDAALADHVTLAERHLAAVEKHHDRPVRDLVFYEFGAGWDLSIPLALWGLGVRRQRLVDLRPLAKPSLIADVATRLPRLMSAAEPFEPIQQAKAFEQLRERYGIEYSAPADARRVALPDGSIDAITSTSTLEHIPRVDLELILAECHRLLTADGVITAHIACDDHYAAADANISRLNFLRYSRAQWRFANPPLLHQNRLRQSDYLKLFVQAGFELLDMESRQASPSEKKGLFESWQPAEAFNRYETADLTVTHVFVVARKAVANA
jgi:hypothetical protein